MCSFGSRHSSLLIKHVQKKTKIYKHKIDSSFYAREYLASWECGNVLECIGASILFLSSPPSWSLKSVSNCLRSRAHFGGGGSYHRKAVNERNSIHTSKTCARARTNTLMSTMSKRESKQQYKIYASSRCERWMIRAIHYGPNETESDLSVAMIKLVIAN